MEGTQLRGERPSTGSKQSEDIFIPRTPSTTSRQPSFAMWTPTQPRSINTPWKLPPTIPVTPRQSSNINIPMSWRHSAITSTTPKQSDRIVVSDWTPPATPRQSSRIHMPWRPPATTPMPLRQPYRIFNSEATTSKISRPFENLFNPWAPPSTLPTTLRQSRGVFGAFIPPTDPVTPRQSGGLLTSPPASATPGQSSRIVASESPIPKIPRQESDESVETNPWASPSTSSTTFQMIPSQSELNFTSGSTSPARSGRTEHILSSVDRKALKHICSDIDEIWQTSRNLGMPTYVYIASQLALYPRTRKEPYTAIEIRHEILSNREYYGRRRGILKHATHATLDATIIQIMENMQLEEPTEKSWDFFNIWCNPKPNVLEDFGIKDWKDIGSTVACRQRVREITWSLPLKRGKNGDFVDSRPCVDGRNRAPCLPPSPPQSLKQLQVEERSSLRGSGVSSLGLGRKPFAPPRWKCRDSPALSTILEVTSKDTSLEDGLFEAEPSTRKSLGFVIAMEDDLSEAKPSTPESLRGSRTSSIGLGHEPSTPSPRRSRRSSVISTILGLTSKDVAAKDDLPEAEPSTPKVGLDEMCYRWGD